MNPECYLCSWELYYFFIRLLGFITSLIQNKHILLEFFQLLAEIASVTGILVYLELIELKFFGLNYNLR